MCAKGQVLSLKFAEPLAFFFDYMFAADDMEDETGADIFFSRMVKAINEQKMSSQI